MNIDEYLDDWLAKSLRMYSGRPCFRCEGNGKVFDFENEVKNESDTPEGRTFVTVWPRITCPDCEGRAIYDATVLDASVQCMVSGAVLGVIMHSRAANNFGSLNAAIDWYERFFARLVVETPTEIVEGQVALLREDAVQQTEQPLRMTGALSDEDLRELGIELDGQEEA